MKRLSETHGPLFELTRHFLGRMFDSELFSTAGRWRSAAVGAFAMLLVTGVVAFYQRPAGIAGEVGRMLLFFALAGLIAVLQWQALLPSRRDYLALASLPVRPWQVFAARFLAFSIFSALVVAALVALPSLCAAPAFAGQPYWANVIGNAAASSLACFSALFSMVALQAILLNALPGRVYVRISAYVQGTAVAVFFLAALESWHVSDWAPSRAEFLDHFSWAPPVWFAALHRVLSGGDSQDANLLALATRGLIACTGVAALALTDYFFSYRRYRSLLLEGTRVAPAAIGRRWNIVSIFVREPRRAAILDFMDKTLSRSRTHRLVLLGYAGLAFGLLINSALLALAAAHWRVDWDSLLPL